MTVPVFVLAAGLGTRLRPLTDWLPKPLLPVGDRPAIEHVLSAVRPLGGPIVANAHHRAADLRAFVEAAARDVLLSGEARILGTAGGLARAGRLLGPGDVLVWNADILSSLDPALLVRAHEEAGDAGATLAVRLLPAGEGNVGVDDRGRIVRLRRETVAPGEAKGGLFLGIHVVGERLRAALPEEGCLVGDAYLPALRQGQTLRAFEVQDEAWHDIGTLGDYEAANRAWLAARGGSSFVAEGATVAPGVTLRRCILGRDARVEGAGTLDRCIVWPGARVDAPSAPAVVTPWGTVPLGPAPR
jgi:mannose-1-phosphate guanylyltransferase